jgi:hypothetical protein
MSKSPCPFTVTTARTLGEGFVDSGTDASPHSDILLRKRGKHHESTGKRHPFLSLSANVKISSRQDKKNSCCAKKKKTCCASEASATRAQKKRTRFSLFQPT